MYHIVEFDKSRAEDYLRIVNKPSSSDFVCYCTKWNMTQAEIDKRILEPVKKMRNSFLKLPVKLQLK